MKNAILAKMTVIFERWRTVERACPRTCRNREEFRYLFCITRGCDLSYELNVRCAEQAETFQRIGFSIGMMRSLISTAREISRRGLKTERRRRSRHLRF